MKILVLKRRQLQRKRDRITWRRPNVVSKLTDLSVGKHARHGFVFFSSKGPSNNGINKESNNES